MSDSARDRLRKILDYGSKPKKTSPAPAPPTPPAPPEPAQSKPPSPPAARTPPTPVHSETAQPAPPSALLKALSTRPEPSSPAPQETAQPDLPPPRTSTLASLASRPAFLGTDAQPLPAQEPPAGQIGLRGFLQELRAKMAQLAEDFAQGKLNRMQFQEIYAHYQKQRQSVEEALVRAPGSDQWRNNVAIGMTGMLRERHSAKILSYAIYDNTSGMPLASVGTFRIDTSLLVPMLSSFRSAATEMFGAGLRSTEIEGGHWLCFVPGQYSTLIVLFSIEPARVQLTLVEDLHRDFEVANRVVLANGRGREAAELFTQIWALDKTQMA